MRIKFRRMSVSELAQPVEKSLEGEAHQDLIEVDALGLGHGQPARPNGRRQILLYASASR